MSASFEIGDRVRVKNCCRDVESGVWLVIGFFEEYVIIKRRLPDVSKHCTSAIVRLADELELDVEPWTPENPWIEHPDFEVEEWKDEIRADNTRLGYIAWVNHLLHVKRDG